MREAVDELDQEALRELLRGIIDIPNGRTLLGESMGGSGRSSPIEGVPFDERAGRFANDQGRILPGLYCVGWAKRGPSGTIGTNRPDGYSVIDVVDEDIGSGHRKRGREGFDDLAAERRLDIVTFRDWQKIEEAEIAAARDGAPREKFVDIESMIAARGL